MRSPALSSRSGFTLLELAIVLTITGIMMGMALPLISQWLAYKRLNETRESMAEIRMALAQYYKRNGSYPCPASFRDGEEVFADSKCASGSGVNAAGLDREGVHYDQDRMVVEGGVPYRRLNIARSSATDGWGNPILYAVTSGLTDPDTFNAYGGKIAVTDAAGRSVLFPEKSALWALVSFGPDGILPDDREKDACGAGPQAANCDHDGVFIAAPLARGDEKNRFDDVVLYRTWVDYPEKTFPDQCVIVPPRRIRENDAMHVVQEGMIAQICGVSADGQGNGGACLWMVCRNGMMVPGFLQNEAGP